MTIWRNQHSKFPPASLPPIHSEIPISCRNSSRTWDQQWHHLDAGLSINLVFCQRLWTLARWSPTSCCCDCAASLFKVTCPGHCENFAPAAMSLTVCTHEGDDSDRFSLSCKGYAHAGQAHVVTRRAARHGDENAISTFSVLRFAVISENGGGANLCEPALLVVAM